jgi:hypothetical protein
MSIIYNMAGTESFNITLKRMSELNGLAAYIEEVAKGKNDNTTAIIKLIGEMSKKIQSVKDNVANIRTGSLEVGSRIKEVIAESDTKQKEKLEKIKTSIKSLGQVKDINDSVKSLDDTVSDLLNKVTGPGSGSGPGPGPGPGPGSGAVPVAATTDPTKGGYTYGKSKKRGKGRRKRTKKSRKKGSNKK